MFEPARQFLDNKIDRRTFITRLTKTGVSLTGAAAIANALVSPTHAADGERVKPEASRILKDMTGGDLMCEFMTDWGVPYLFGLAGSEETGFLDALVDRTHTSATPLACMKVRRWRWRTDILERQVKPPSFNCTRSRA